MSQLPFHHFLHSVVQRTDEIQYQEEFRAAAGADVFSARPGREGVLFVFNLVFKDV